MDPFSLGLAVVGTLDVCIRGGDRLVTICHSFENAEQETNELFIRLEDHWLKLRSQIGFLRDVWDSLDDDFQAHQIKVLNILRGKIEAICSTLEGLFKRPTSSSGDNKNEPKKLELKRLKYALYMKDSLKNAVEEIKDWHSMFDPSFFLVLRVAKTDIDRKLLTAGQSNVTTNGSLQTLSGVRNAMKGEPKPGISRPSVFIPAKTLTRQRTQISFSSSYISQDEISGKTIIVDRITCDPNANMGVLTRDTRNLANTLSQVDPLQFGLLQCNGVIKVAADDGEPGKPSETKAFEFVFDIPKELTSPNSLRHFLSAVNISHPLDERFTLAKKLANSVMFVHTFDFVHKNIRSDTILVFEDHQSVLGCPFLMGMEKVRPAEGRTYRIGDAVWEKNLYRHPSRQGSLPEEDYCMQHDIYSLGVVLLEIGLWTSFLCWEPGSDEPIPNPILEIESKLVMKDQRKKAFAIKRRLTSLAQDRLPSAMGSRYAETVVACLTCLDRGENSFGDEEDFMDDDGILVGVRYIEKILLQLQAITV